MKAGLPILVMVAAVAQAQTAASRPSMTDAQVLQWLQALKPLPKVHYSWPLRTSLLDNARDPRLFEYIRITHAATVWADYVTPEQIDRLVRICKSVNSGDPSLPATLAVCCQPWHRRFGENLPPTDQGPTHVAELAHLRNRLTQIRDWVRAANVRHNADIRVSALLFNAERFWVRAGDRAWNAAITAKHKSAYDAAQEVFPHARIEWFGRGVYDVPSGDGWRQAGHLTLDEPGETFSVRLYTPWELGNTREAFRRTHRLARARGVGEVTPWISLGSGYRRKVDTYHEWDPDYGYDPVYAWQLGREINNPKYAKNPGLYAPWEAAKVVIFYPSPFYEGSRFWTRHFIAYVLGAHEISRLP